MKLIAGLVLPLALALPADASATELTDAQMNLIATVARLGSNPTADDVLTALTRAIRIYDAAKDGLDAEDLKQVDRVRQAQERAIRAPGFLQADLDNDMKVTRAEYDLVRRANPNSMHWRSLTLGSDPFLAFDLDGDDVITWAELTRDQRAPTFAPGGELAAMTAEFDPTPDGKFTLEDAKTIADRVMAALDTNRDGVIAVEETPQQKAFDQQRAMQQSARSRPPSPASLQTKDDVCAFPKAAADQDVIRVGAYEGAVRSNIHAGDPDRETRVVTVTVEPGDSRLYVVASAYEGVIWTFEGAVERLSQVAVGGYHPQGVVGVPKDKVVIAPALDCLETSYAFGTAKGLIARNETERRVGKPVAQAGGDYSLEAIAIPSMQVTAKRPRTHGEEEPVAEIDPRLVVSAKSFAAYSVLPGDAGLGKLLDNGSLVRLSERKYKIVKPFPQFPAGLSGSRRATFILAKGIPLPAGDIGRSCVVMEETGALIRGTAPLCGQ